MLGSRDGVLNKVVLRWENNMWWLSRPQWSSGAEAILHAGPIYDQYNEFHHLNSNSSSWSADYLVAFISGHKSYEMESLSDTAIKDSAIATLNAIFGAPNVPDPTHVTITRWGQDPYARGSYSGMGIYSDDGRSDEDLYFRDVLRDDISSRVYFAGEHTSEVYPATLMGAYTSGLAAANRLDDDHSPASAPVACGDGDCKDSESCSSCEQDCGECPDCGDGVCDASESCSSCEDDCGPCQGELGTGNCDGCISISKSVYAPGEIIVVSWNGIPTPRNKDWIGTFVAGNRSDNYMSWGNSSNYTGDTAGAGTMNIPAPTASGVYDLRLFYNDGYAPGGSKGSEGQSNLSFTVSSSRESMQNRGQRKSFAITRY